MKAVDRTDPCSAFLWHTLTQAEIEQTLQTGSAGLNAAEVSRRIKQYGSNRLSTQKRRSVLSRLLMQFHNILLYVMLGAAAITALLGHWIDTGVLLAAVVINAMMGFIQEGKAEAALDAIRAMLSPRATVIRNGKKHEINAENLVPGDWVILAAGDRVPADLRLVSTTELRIDEAALTGESVPVEKNTDAAQAATPLGDRYGMAYSGTVVVYGMGMGIVIATGSMTELGKINQLLIGIQSLATPLLRQIDGFGRVLAITIITLCVITFILGTMWRNNAPAEMFMMVVALAASAIPEGLPAIMTVTLAIGVQRMARRNAIIRRLPAVEALGSVTVICSDKTGTLTCNEMTVQRIVCARHIFDVGGTGYSPAGDFSEEGRIIDPDRYPALCMAIRTGVLCNEARLREENGQWSVEGDPTEGALLVAGNKAGFSQHIADAAWPRVDSIPFDSRHRFMATYHRDSDGKPWIFIKGAPERILEICSLQLDDDGEKPLVADYWYRQVSRTAASGLRLLGLACKRTAPAKQHLDFSDVESGYILLAMVGIIDPPREEAVQAIAECHRAGIQVKMITGDHEETARAIGAQLNIGIGKKAMSGADITLVDDTQLHRIVQQVEVFARASPEHKLRLVQALQEDGHLVAMTGDGVNDAPALKKANVGVAMGMKGTEAAKEASDIILADDNFATIVNAVREGRTIYDNIKKCILFMLPTNGGEALVVIAAILFELILPLTPVQVLWINMVTSSTLGLALAFEPAERNIMHRHPRPPDEPLLSGFLIWRVLMVSMLMMGCTLFLFMWELDHGSSIGTARTIAVSTVVMAEVFYLMNSRYIFASVMNREGLTGNYYVLISIVICITLQFAYTEISLMQTIFHSTSLSILEWIKVLCAGLLIFFIAELEKMAFRAGIVPPKIQHRR